MNQNQIQTQKLEAWLFRRKQITDLYRADVSARQIAQILGVTRAWVYTVLKQEGIIVGKDKKGGDNGKPENV